MAVNVNKVETCSPRFSSHILKRNVNVRWLRIEKIFNSTVTARGRAARSFKKEVRNFNKL